MGEHYPGLSSAQTGATYEEYQRGDLSTAGVERVASASGAIDEKHASGSYGAAPELLAGLVRKSGAL